VEAAYPSVRERWARPEPAAARSENALQRLPKRSELPAQVVGAPPVFDIIFTEQEIHQYRDTRRGNSRMMARFNTLLLESGVLKGETKHYFSLAHTHGTT
jgi:glutamate-1-semialdehyde 2,1-aminomutase